MSAFNYEYMHTQDIVDEDHDNTLKKIKQLTQMILYFYREEIMILRNLVYLTGGDRNHKQRTLFHFKCELYSTFHHISFVDIY